MAQADTTSSIHAMSDVSDEEGSHFLDEFARLPRLSHRLNEVGDWMQLAAHQSDDELVVGAVEAVASKADVMRQVLRSVRHTDLRMFPQNLRLLVRLEAGECSRSSKRVPDMPAVPFVRHVLDRTLEKRPFELWLVPRRIRTPEHGEAGTCNRAGQIVGRKQRPHGSNEMGRVLAPSQQTNAARFGGVGVHDRSHSLAGARFCDCFPHPISRFALGRIEDEELHEKPPIRSLTNAVALAAVLGHVDRRQTAGLLRVVLCHQCVSLASGRLRVARPRSTELSGHVRPGVQPGSTDARIHSSRVFGDAFALLPLGSVGPVKRT
jgi:hypothetical protein